MPAAGRPSSRPSIATAAIVAARMHARLGRDEQDEADERGDSDDHPHAAPGTRRCRGQERDSHDERAVRPGHGRQMRQRRLLHVGVELRADGRRVTDGEPRNEPRTGRRQPVDRRHEALPQLGRHGEES